jgi:hypothetical protein
MQVQLQRHVLRGNAAAAAAASPRSWQPAEVTSWALTSHLSSHPLADLDSNEEHEEQQQQDQGGAAAAAAASPRSWALTNLDDGDELEEVEEEAAAPAAPAALAAAQEAPGASSQDAASSSSDAGSGVGADCMAYVTVACAGKPSAADLGGQKDS